MADSNPYLSIVVTSRNDNHGGDMLPRMTLFMKGLLDQTRKFKIPAELVFVEWNPPSDRPLLNEVLPKPGPDDWLTIRYIVVSNEHHQRLNRSDSIPLFQMIAKNVGIRRAQGAFVLATNVDVILSDALMARLAQRDLQENCFYRANRWDIPGNVSPDWSTEELLDFGQKNVFRKLGKDPNYLFLHDVPAWVYDYSLLAWGMNALNKILYRRRNDPVQEVFDQMDTKACGDFTLMARDSWFAMRGYAEFEMYSIHIDSLGLYAAAAEGLKQVIFQPTECVYHIDHHDGWEAMNPFERIRYLERKPGISLNEIWEAGLYALRTGSKIRLNETNWGFGDETLTEYPFFPQTNLGPDEQQ